MPYAGRKLPFGPYWVSFGGLFTGLTEGTIRHEETPSGVPVRATVYGDSVIDEIYTGKNMFVTILFKEWNKAEVEGTLARTLDIYNPFDPLIGNSGLVGQSKWDTASTLLLTAVTGTPCQTDALPATRLYNNAIVASDTAILQEFGAVERNVPITFRILPDPVSSSVNDGKLTFFTDS